MLKIEKTDIHGWEAAIRGARNSFNSWDKSDSRWCCGDKKCGVMDGCDLCCDVPHFCVGGDDLALMKKLAKAGPSHAKYRRFITVTMDVTGPLYWWKEMDTYKVGTVGNSCSTMHKIADKEFTEEDFSFDHIIDEVTNSQCYTYRDTEWDAGDVTDLLIGILNHYRDLYLETKDKKYWWQMIQLLPSSYNQKRTLLVNYEVLANIYHQRKGHKLDEWRTFCEWIKGLPMGEIITGDEKE